MNYKDQLKCVEWKIKRFEILERDEHKCTRCGHEKILHVHHLEYHPNKLAWEYDNEHLITLCDLCHEYIHSEKHKEKLFLRDVNEKLNLSSEFISMDNEVNKILQIMKFNATRI